ncbi:P-II family nitrogen regulator [uncultured Ilyobacter sp.]|uniref:P-II family nitrogen regulator n=1 Tax=uncultured Ilyobacter sp. TaxID=544433 RepID=UPI0029F4A7B9|nr:P-II family nitrogen regulator [uncultured Ilyobacter sp.]
MKRIQAIIRPNRLEVLKKALVDNGIGGMTVTEVRGFGRQKGKIEIFRGVEYKTDFIKKLKIEILCKEENLEKIVKVIMESVREGEPGDGKIFIFPNEEVIRISTKEKGKKAI